MIFDWQLKLQLYNYHCLKYSCALGLLCISINNQVMFGNVTIFITLRIIIDRPQYCIGRGFVKKHSDGPKWDLIKT